MATLVQGAENLDVIQLIAQMQDQQRQIAELLTVGNQGGHGNQDVAPRGPPALQMSKKALILEGDPTFFAFKQWQKSWDIQASVKRVDKYPVTEQINFFKDHLSLAFRDTLDGSIVVKPAVLNDPIVVKDYINAISQYIIQNANLTRVHEEEATARGVSRIISWLSSC